jgi:general secretion pathway protein F
MPSYNARIITDDGVKSIKIDARDDVDAERIAAKRGTVIGVKKRFAFDLNPGMNASERNTFMLRLSSMVGSKMGVTDALRLLNQTFTGRIKNAAGLMLQRIEQGMNLHDAIEIDRKNFPVATAALVKAGVQGGETWRALRDAAAFEYQIRSIQKSSSKDAMSAIFSFLVAAALMISTTEYFGPQVLDNAIFKGAAGVDVKWIETTGKVLSGIMVVMLVVFGFFGWLATAGRAVMPDLADKVILKIPYYKDLVLSRNNYVVLYKLGLLIGSGVRMEEALALTAEGSPRGALRSDIERALKAIRGGRSWARAMETLHPTDQASLASSSDRDDIARTLDMLATQYRDLFIQRMQSMAPALQMISALFMTAAGGVLFGLTILPMLQLASDIK